MAWRGVRPDASLGRPLQLAIAASGRDQEGFDRRASVRSRERGVSAAGHPARLQDLESADSTKAVTCAEYALLPPSGSPLRRPQRNNEEVVVPFPLPWL